MNKVINQAIKALVRPRPIPSEKAQQLIHCLYELTTQLEGLYELISKLEKRYDYKLQVIDDSGDYPF